MIDPDRDFLPTFIQDGIKNKKNCHINLLMQKSKYFRADLNFY